LLHVAADIRERATVWGHGNGLVAVITERGRADLSWPVSARAPLVRAWAIRRANYSRRIEYSISASVMIVLIGLFTGIRGLAAVVAIFTANTAMILYGQLMERQQRPGAADWSAFCFGSLVGIVQWALIAVYVAQPAQVPGFVYAITIIQFVLLFSFAANMACNTRRSGAGATTSTARSSTSP
jgi:hypothetical protein